MPTRHRELSRNCSTEVEFYPTVADASNYPKALFPLLPTASINSWGDGGKGIRDSAFLQNGESFYQGRYALAEALRRSGAGSGKAVLLPAYHCRAMVEPALYLSAQPCFYPVLANLTPDFSALTALMECSPAPVVAMVITHYFGFPNEVEEAARFCATHRIALIEDCAHALYGRTGERVLGQTGSYATASIWKFLPVRDGALLLDNTATQNKNNNAPQALSAEARTVAAMLQGWYRRATRRVHPSEVDPIELRARATIIANRPAAQKNPPSFFKEFSPSRSLLSGSRWSKWTMSHAAHGHIGDRRRANYLKWLTGMSSMRGAQPLFPRLADGVVPYAFPLLIDPAGLGFHLLKLAGIPFWRWEDMAVTDCPVSREYRIRVLQLPCHQELRAAELDWMIATTQSLLRN
jgi:perosamine synthetase